MKLDDRRNATSTPTEQAPAAAAGPRLVLVGPQTATFRLMVHAHRPVFLRVECDPDGTFSRDIREAVPFKQLVAHGIELRVLHNVCMIFRTAPAGRARRCQRDDLAQHDEQQIRSAALKVRSPETKAALEALAADLVAARAGVRKAHVGRPFDPIQLYCDIARGLTDARPDHSRFHAQFRQLAELIFEKRIGDEAYAQVVARVNRYVRSHPLEGRLSNS